jgi:hypothetical protein
MAVELSLVRTLARWTAQPRTWHAISPRTAWPRVSVTKCWSGSPMSSESRTNGCSHRNARDSGHRRAQKTHWISVGARVGFRFRAQLGAIREIMEISKKKRSPFDRICQRHMIAWEKPSGGIARTMNSKKSPMLSKSKYLAGLQCPLRLWHQCFNPDLASPVSPSQQALFEAGHEVGRLATRLYLRGVLVESDPLRHAGSGRDSNQDSKGFENTNGISSRLSFSKTVNGAEV